jgi:hypothetical protein
MSPRQKTFASCSSRPRLSVLGHASAPGAAAGALIVSDIEAAHDEPVRRGIDASEMWHGPPFPPGSTAQRP